MIALLGSLVVTFVVVINAAPTSISESQVVVVSQVNNHVGEDHQFDWSYKLSDGQEVLQGGTAKELPDGSKTLVFRGSYSFVAPDGVEYSVSYTADENGFHPVVSSANNNNNNVQIVALPAPVGSIDPKVLASLVG